MEGDTMKKLRSRGGFSLPEVLMAVALLAILAAGSAVASGVLISTRNGMIQTADAQVVGGTVMESIAGEIRYGLNMTSSVTGADAVITFDSAVFGPGTTFGVDPDGHVIATSGTSTYDLLPESAYSSLKITKLDVKKAGDMVKITVEVGTLWSDDVTVKPLNGIK